MKSHFTLKFLTTSLLTASIAMASSTALAANSTLPFTLSANAAAAPNEGGAATPAQPAPVQLPKQTFGETGSFSAHLWTYRTFWWTPGEAAPTQLRTVNKNARVVATKGWVKLKKGQYTFVFTYQSGPLKLDILGVDICTLSGKVVAHDYHVGSAGLHPNNYNYTYKVDVPETGFYELRYFVDNNKQVKSNGVVNITPAIESNTLLPIDDLQEATEEFLVRTPSVSPTETAHEGHATIGLNQALQSSWSSSSWTLMETQPEGVKNLNVKKAQTKHQDYKLFLASSGTLTTEFQYTTGKHALLPVGIELLNESGAVVASNYHSGETGGNTRDNIYALRAESPGNYTLRFIADCRPDFNSNGNIRLSLLERDALHMVAGAHFKVNVSEDAQNKHPQRILNGATIAPHYALPTTLSYQDNKQTIWNFANNPEQYVKVVAGTETRISTNWWGYAMHGYLYMDKNRDDRFDVSSITDEELLATTYVSGKKKSIDGTVSDYSGNIAAAGANFNVTIKAPSTPGLYRLRYKVEWDNLNPGAGNPQYMPEHGGYLVDFVLDVVDPVTQQAGDRIFSHTVRTTETASGNIATLQLPFAATMPDGLTAYALESNEITTEATFVPLETKVIPANTPVLLTSDTPGDYTLTSTYTTETIKTKLQGTCQPLTPSERDEANYKYMILTLDEHRTPIFRWVAANANIQANRAFLKLPLHTGPAGQGATPQSIKIKFPAPVLNAIEKVESGSETLPTYNLAGQRIDSNAHGVVIQNGKKVFVP